MNKIVTKTQVDNYIFQEIVKRNWSQNAYYAINAQRKYLNEILYILRNESQINEDDFINKVLRLHYSNTIVLNKNI